jgi:hypothetical protein
MRVLAAVLAGVIPWIPAQPPRGPAHPPLAPACRASQLHASLFLQGATGSLTGGLDLTNRGDTPCALLGRPQLSLVGGTSRWRPGRPPQGLTLSPDPLADPPGSLRALAPGKTADVLIWWQNWCGKAPSALQLGLAGGRALRVALAQAPRCDQASMTSTFDFGSFEPRSRRLPDSSRLPLSVAITGPMPVSVKNGAAHAFRARRGELLRYTVVVTNTGTRPFRFGARCPAYVQDFGTQVAYVLNCHPAGAIAPGASVRFAMQVDVPSQQKLGYAAIGWELAPNTYDAPQTAAPVWVVR